MGLYAAKELEDGRVRGWIYLYALSVTLTSPLLTLLYALSCPGLRSVRRLSLRSPTYSSTEKEFRYPQPRSGTSYDLRRMGSLWRPLQYTRK